jgi:hypothetical protein
MRTHQLKLQIENDGDDMELAQLWTAFAPGDQVQIARAYARVLIKAAKVVPGDLAEEKGRSDDEP